jgi:hypothetical protein
MRVAVGISKVQCTMVLINLCIKIKEKERSQITFVRGQYYGKCIRFYILYSFLHRLYSIYTVFDRLVRVKLKCQLFVCFFEISITANSLNTAPELCHRLASSSQLLNLIQLLQPRESDLLKLYL